MTGGMERPVEGQEGDASKKNHKGAEQGGDEPRGALRHLGRGLSDPHGVDKGVRYE